jgi:glutathione S-transferase
MTTAATIPTTPAAPTRVATNSLQAALDQDLRTACEDFTEAREQRARKDTPAHRTAVAESLARLDALLDMYLEIRGIR